LNIRSNHFPEGPEAIGTADAEARSPEKTRPLVNFIVTLR
jgi:hypothetical protein